MKRRGLSLLVGLLGGLLSAPTGSAQEQSVEDLRKEIQTVKDSLKAIQADIQEIKTLLQTRLAAAPPQNVVLELGSNVFKGERTAKLTLVEFSDYQ